MISIGGEEQRMKIGLYTDGLPDLSSTTALDWAAGQGIAAVEIATGDALC